MAGVLQGQCIAEVWPGEATAAEASIQAGYTRGMKTAISIPEDVFRQAERLARRTRKSRSQLFTDAVREYVSRHAPDHVTDAMDRVCHDLDSPNDNFVSTAGRRLLERVEW